VIVMPAIDLREGACVQLVGGSFADERVRIADPLAAAQRWSKAGFRHLHVVDLDAAVSGTRRVNVRVMRNLVAQCGMETQLGGGVRDSLTLDGLLALGAQRVVAGTRALEDPEWLRREAARRPGRVIAAVDVRNGAPVLRGWREAASITLESALAALEGIPLAAVLVTAVHVEGRMKGPDLALVDKVASLSSAPIIASGGIASERDLRELQARGVWAAVVGMALYTGVLDARRTAEEFAS
jgi:phosphoribosylformimino-5-aminoimidazole carboxamide ribotide isomerase